MINNDRSNFYSGETNKMLRNGFGFYVYENKFFKYEGEWVDGRKHGNGRLIMGDGGYYEGQFCKGEICGNGERFWASNRNYYFGKFQNGELNGSGTMQYGNGDLYEGEWNYNLRQGKGKLSMKVGDVYEGEFYKNQKHGEGVEKYIDGSTYDGYWVCGKRQGHGLITFDDGSVYKGQFNHDRFHGEGVLTHSSGIIYSGMWGNGYPLRMPSQINLDNVSRNYVQGNTFDLIISIMDNNAQVIQEESGRLFKISCGVKYVPSTETNSLFKLIEQMQIQPLETPLYPVILVPLHTATASSLGLSGEENEDLNEELVLKLCDKGRCEWRDLSIGKIEANATSDYLKQEHTETLQIDKTDELCPSKTDIGLEGEYLLIIEDVTENPFMGIKIGSLYIPINVLQKTESLKSKEGMKPNKNI